MAAKAYKHIDSGYAQPHLNESTPLRQEAVKQAAIKKVRKDIESLPARIKEQPQHIQDAAAAQAGGSKTVTPKPVEVPEGEVNEEVVEEETVEGGVIETIDEEKTESE